MRQLLANRKELTLVVRAKGPHSFPVEASGKVTELEMAANRGQGPVSQWLEWSGFSSSRQLHFRGSGYIHQTDIDGVCEALEAGHLQQLQELSFDLCSSVYLNFQPLMRALGSKPRHITTSNKAVIKHLHNLTALQSVHVWCSASADGLIELCKHPSLQSVWLHNKWTDVQHDFSSESCSFHSLHVGFSYPPITLEALSRLPHGGLQQLYVYGGISCQLSGVQPESMLDSDLLNKILLVPTARAHQQVFTAADMMVGAASILSRLQSDCWLDINSKQPGIVHALWAALHPSVSSVRFQTLCDLDYHNFWDGVPTSVLHVELTSPDCMRNLYWQPSISNIDFDVVRTLVASTPMHVKSLGMLAVDEQFWAGMRATKLRMAAPSHLSLKLLQYVA